jgi:hypothetical protein
LGSRHAGRRMTLRLQLCVCFSIGSMATATGTGTMSVAKSNWVRPAANNDLGGRNRAGSSGYLAAGAAQRSGSERLKSGTQTKRQRNANGKGNEEAAEGQMQPETQMLDHTPGDSAKRGGSVKARARGGFVDFGNRECCLLG